jgi:hypothetical protein
LCSLLFLEGSKGGHAIYEYAATILLMKFLLVDGFSVGLEDSNVPKAILEEPWNYFQKQ